MTSWFNLSSLTEQGSKLVEVYANDLTEFATTIKSEASQLIQPVMSAVGSKATIENDGLHSIHKKRGQILKQETWEQRLIDLQKDVNTYIVEVPKLSKNDANNTNNLEEEDIFTKQFYEKWDLESKTSEISKLLEENEIVRNKHEELVPVQVKYEDFWIRYYYRIERFLQEEEKRKKLQTLAKEGEELEGWDDEDEDDVYEELGEDHSSIQLQYLKLKEILLTFLTKYEDDRTRELHELLLKECPFVFETSVETKDEVESVEQLIEPINEEKETNKSKEEIEITDSEEKEKGEQIELDEQKETEQEEDFENWE
jgi:hypothetical protein